MLDLSEEVVHLARLSLAGRPQDVQRFLGRLVAKMGESHPESAKKISELLQQNGVGASPLRDFATAAPVDADSRLRLIRHEYPVALDAQPIWPTDLMSKLHQLVAE